MDTNTFYAITAATCFTLVGLWWSVVKDKPEWATNEAKKRMAGGVYASFLIPGLMSLAAQIGVESSLIWRGVFFIAALAGITFSSKLINLTRETNPKGAFSRNSWVVPVLFGICRAGKIRWATSTSIGGASSLRLDPVCARNGMGIYDVASITVGVTLRISKR